MVLGRGELVVFKNGATDYEETEQSRYNPEFDEYEARREAGRQLARRGYRGGCTDDCSGHEAGFQWAHDNRLTRPQYTGDSQSFDEGQEAYTRALSRRVDELREEYEADPEGYSPYP